MDLFAGPGGLGEGFASLVDKGKTPYRIGISVEKDTAAHRTLTLRAFLRQYQGRQGSLPPEFISFHAGQLPEPDWSSIDAKAWRSANEEARALELGTPAAAQELDTAISKIRKQANDTVLIGGPPCQAYSLVGRARSRGTAGYIPEQDERHYLFREYIRVLRKLRPAVFVMENVKGILSSTVESRLVFEMLMEDLSSLGTRRGQHYELRAIGLENGVARLVEPTLPSDFVVRAEEFGIPQRRHRVIIIGIRSDCAPAKKYPFIRIPQRTRTVADVIAAMPSLRSGISRGQDCSREWTQEIISAAQLMVRLPKQQIAAPVRELLREIAQSGKALPNDRSLSTLPNSYGNSSDNLLAWIERPELCALAQHQTRGHMRSDLRRYLFVSAFGAVKGFSPKASDFPDELSPDHRNWQSGIFDDRFRVQLATQPATTVTSHIAKDGHYFIHPDPFQCRSLTVREAARLQTFPDDYLFMGNRTQQYVQVGNAVPPYLARIIAKLVLKTIKD